MTAPCIKLLKATLAIRADLPLEDGLDNDKKAINTLHTKTAEAVATLMCTTLPAVYAAEVHSRISELQALASASQQSTDADVVVDMLDESIEIVAEIGYWSTKR